MEKLLKIPAGCNGKTSNHCEIKSPDIEYFIPYNSLSRQMDADAIYLYYGRFS
jgi:hypothetical protein